MLSSRVSCGVVMDMCRGYVVMVMLWPVEWSGEMDEGMCFYCYSMYVEICYVEDAEFCHEWSCMCSGWHVFDESDDLLLCSDEGLYVRRLLV